MALRLTPDTNVLVRAILNDDAQQSPIAQKLLTEAESVMLTTPALCEFCWVLGSVYKQSRSDIAATLRALVTADNVVFDGAALDAGLAHLDANGDYADGVIAFEGRRMGSDRFVSFDRGAVRRATALGVKASEPD